MDKDKTSSLRVIGLTGSFGTGKSAVAGMMVREGAVVIDADKIVHQIMKPGTEVHSILVSHFGPGIIKKGGGIDRRLLSEIVFAPGGRDKLNKLCRIIHPRVIKIIKEKVRALREEGLYRLVVINAPLLIEAGLDRIVDEVVVVRASRQNQIKRCQARYGLSKKEILARINYQMPIEEKIKRADFVIDNDGTLTRTRGQVKNILSEIISDLKALNPR